MKKLCAIILTAAILLGMLGIAAAETSREAFEITDITVSKNGSLKIRWVDPQNNAPYRILFQPVTSANTETPSNKVFVWCNSGDINETDYTEMYVVPDASWWFIVEDSAGNQRMRKYEAKDSNFEGARGIEVSGWSQSATKKIVSTEYKKTGNDDFDAPVLKFEDIMTAAYDVTYGVRLSLQCKDTSLYGDYLLKYTMTALGFAAENSPIVVGFTEDESRPLVFNKDYTEMDFFVNLSPYFKRLHSVYDDVSGPYLLRIYFDGEFVADVGIWVE